MSKTNEQIIAELKTALSELDTLYNGVYQSPESVYALRKTIQSFNITITDWNTLLTYINSHRSSLDGLLEMYPDFVNAFEEITNNFNNEITRLDTAIEGKVDETVLKNTLKNYVKDVEITDIKTVAEVLEEIGGLNHIFSFDLIDIKYFGLFVEGQGTNIDLELWSPSGTSKVVSIDTTQLFRTEMSNYVVESAYFPIVAISQPITTLSDDEMTILGQDNSFIVYNGRVYVKSNDTGTTIEFVCPDIDDTSANGYHTQSKYEIIVNKSTKGAVVLGSTNYYYDRSQTNDLLLGKQNLLVSGTNIKTINNESILGSGNIDTGSGATWGSITGNIGEQEDLQDELKDIREVAEGKNKSYVLSYNDTIASAKQELQNFGYFFVYNSSTNEWEEKRAELLNGDYDNYVVSNATFNSQSNIISNLTGCLIFRAIPEEYIDNVDAGMSHTYYMLRYPNSSFELFKIGDNFYVIETDVPDRWVGKKVAPLALYKLETSKVDLDNYYTKTESDENVVKNQANMAIVKDALTNVNGRTFQTYTATLITSGYTYYLIQKNGANLTKADAIEYMNYMTGSKFVPEYNYDFPRNTYFVFEDNTIWKPQFDTTNGLLLYKVSDGYVDLTGIQNITGVKTIGDGTGSSSPALYFSNEYLKAQIQLVGYGFRFFAPINATGGSTTTLNVIPNLTNNYDLGNPSLKWRNLYVNGINTNTNGYKLTIPDTSSWTSDKEIATTDQAFNVINADDIVNNTLTQAQYDLITNGKPTLIKGTILFLTNLLVDSVLIRGSNLYLSISSATSTNTYKGLLKVNMSSKLLTISNDKYDYLENIGFLNGKAINYYQNNVYPYATNSTTTLQYETINDISVSADTTFTLATALPNTYPEYKANITNSGASDITITLPSGTLIKGNVSISSNTFVIPSGSSVELNIQNSRAIVVEW